MLLSFMAKVAAIRNRRLSDLMCDNTDLKRIPANVFETGSGEICCGGDGFNGLDALQFVAAP